MKIIPAGKFESALVRLVDELIIPTRNVTGHQYYMDLNRIVDRAFSDGVGTFVALAGETIISSELDWKEPGDQIQLGVHRSRTWDRGSEEDMRHYAGLKSLKEQICNDGVLSKKSLEYITSLDLHSYPENVIESWNKDIAASRSSVLSCYINRLLNQIYTNFNSDKSYILISDQEIEILCDISSAIYSGNIKTDLPFPDLKNRLLNPESFAHGILNFSPKDILSVEHVRANDEVQQYSKKIQAILQQASLSPDDPAITDALIDAYYRTEAGRKVKTIFEVGTWVVKPLHYVPVVGEILSVAEDVKDVLNKSVDRKLKQYEWCFMGVRMQEIAIKDYLMRLSNNRHPTLLRVRD